MFNYLIEIEYDGSNYVGWQSQNGKSIQKSIEIALKKVFKSEIVITGQVELIKVFMLFHNLLVLN